MNVHACSRWLRSSINFQFRFSTTPSLLLTVICNEGTALNHFKNQFRESKRRRERGRKWFQNVKNLRMKRNICEQFSTEKRCSTPYHPGTNTSYKNRINFLYRQMFILRVFFSTLFQMGGNTVAGLKIAKPNKMGYNHKSFFSFFFYFNLEKNRVRIPGCGGPWDSNVIWKHDIPTFKNKNKSRTYLTHDTLLRSDTNASDGWRNIISNNEYDLMNFFPFFLEQKLNFAIFVNTAQ